MSEASSRGNLRGEKDRSQVDQSLVRALQAAMDELSAGGSTMDSSMESIAASLGMLANRLLEGQLADSYDTSLSQDAGGSSRTSVELGRFEIRDILGHGGFGVVFRAFDTVLERDIALKLPRPEQLELFDTKSRLLKEAQTAAVLNHPGIVPVHETGELGSLWYIASAYVDGPTLAVWQQRQAEPIAQRTAARIVSALADAVAHAHQRGILHLDLKPSNVLLEPTEGGDSFPFVPRLTDFGLAARLERDDLSDRVTIAGTLRFMSPEQVRGDHRDISTTSDVYGLGAVLHKLLTGQAPFEDGDSAELAQRIVVEQPRSVRQSRADVSRDLDAICIKCLAKNPEDRYASAPELAEDLHRFLNGRPVAARPVNVIAKLAMACRRRPALSALSGGVILLTLLGAAIIANQRQQTVHHATIASVEKSRADRQIQEAQQWLLEASQVIQETAPYLAQEETVITGLTARIHAHRAQMEKDKASEELRLAALTASASLDAMGAQQATPLQPGHIVEKRTRHAVDMWLRVIEHWPERLAYRRALALLMLGAARYYERSELAHFARQYRAEAASVLSPTWHEGRAKDADIAEMAGQLDKLATVRDGLGHIENANCLRDCAVENWSYLRSKNPANLEFLAGWAIAQRKVASSVSTRQQNDTRDQIFATIEVELDKACDWDTAPASLQLVMADVLCRRASQANARRDSKLALEFVGRSQRYLQLAEQVEPRDPESSRVEIFMMREAAVAHDELGQEREAYAQLKRCREVCRTYLAGASADEPERIRYARLCRSVGERAVRFGETDEAVAAYSEAATAYSNHGHLSVKDLEANAQCVTSLAKLYASTGNEAMAEAQFRLALDLWRRVQKRMPKSSVARAEVASIERKLQPTQNQAAEPVQ